MKQRLQKKPSLLSNAILLIMAGFFCRFLGFFYRIFLSNTLGEEGMGLYQIAIPVFSLALSFCGAGLGTAVSRLISSSTAKEDKNNPILLAGVFLSLGGSMVFCLFLFFWAPWISTQLLSAPSTENLLKIFALSIPFTSLHSVLTGYFMGIFHAEIPALSQVVEECVHFASVFLLWKLLPQGDFDAGEVALGLFLSEFISVLFLLCFLRIKQKPFSHTESMRKPMVERVTEKILPLSRELFFITLPLSGTSVLMSLLRATEAVLIPMGLQLYGFSAAQSVAQLGVLNGMVFPFLFFPCTLTNAVASLLLPTISSAQAEKNQAKIKKITTLNLRLTLGLGLFFTAIFFFSGNFLGTLLFHSTSSGSFLRNLSFLCPFLYLTMTSNGILNGLGKMKQSFFHSLISMLLRLLSVLLLLPRFGMPGFFFGLIFSQAVQALLNLRLLRAETNFRIL